MENAECIPNLGHVTELRTYFLTYGLCSNLGNVSKVRVLCPNLGYVCELGTCFRTKGMCRNLGNVSELGMCPNLGYVSEIPHTIYPYISSNLEISMFCK